MPKFSAKQYYKDSLSLFKTFDSKQSLISYFRWMYDNANKQVAPTIVAYGYDSKQAKAASLKARIAEKMLTKAWLINSN